MTNKRILTLLTLCIALLSAVAASVGIFSAEEHGDKVITSVRGKSVALYGKGVYHQMSAEVAPQGIAQDVVTLCIGIPLLLVSLTLYRKGSLRGRVLLTGALGYFLVTYMFFTLMAMYNQLFLLWVVLLSLCFHAFYISFKQLDEAELARNTSLKLPVRFIGGFLIFCAVAIASLWLSIVLPPVFLHTIPAQVEHYTTLVVQALDLSIGLPAAFIAGVLLIRKRAFGFKLAAVYLVFLAILMTALSAKLIAMAMLGYGVVPAIFIIPVFNVSAIVCAVVMIRNISDPTPGTTGAL